MQALASKASTALGIALGLMLTLLSGIALLGFGLYFAAQHLLAGIYNILGKDVATLLFAVLIVTTVVALVCALIAACVRLGFWLYGVFGRTHATVVAAYEDARLARVDTAGVPPLPRSLLENPRFAAALLALAHTGIEARKPPQAPHTLTYAPHLRYSNDVQGALAEPPAPALSVQDFWSLFTGGHLPQQGFFMGYSLDDGQPILADWRNLYSVLIGGQSGAGKSTLIRSILAQSALQGGRFLVLDPHFSAGEESLGASLLPLQTRMIADPASTDEGMRDTLRYTATIGQRRLQGKDDDRTPLILVVDELTGLLTRSAIADELTGVLGRISQETRKVGVFCLAIGQQFSSEVMSTAVRNSFVSYLSCRTRRDVARIMSGSTTFAKAAETLTTGQAVWLTPAGDFHRLAVPNTTKQHIHQVAQTLTTHPPAAATSPSASPSPAATPLPTAEPNPPAVASAAAEPVGNTFDPRTARVRQLILENKSAKEIIAEIWSTTSGDSYRKASAEYQAIVRQLIRIPPAHPHDGMTG
jgi:ABC-type cobalamin/Fe3+-siderophores transport system ATPase subunit